MLQYINNFTLVIHQLRSLKLDKLDRKNKLKIDRKVKPSAVTTLPHGSEGMPCMQ